MAKASGARWQRRRWIVDGHNAIFALPTAGRLQREQQRFEARLHLEQQLTAFATRLEKPLLVVYDGNEIAANPDARLDGPLQTLYSQPPEEADDRIVYLAQRLLSQGESVAIVTDDRKTLVPRLPKGVQVWGVLDFWDRFFVSHEAAPDASGEAEKALDPEDRDQIASLFLERSEEIESSARRGARRREREAAARWAARTASERDAGEGGSASSRRRREAEPVTDEMDIGWDPNRVFESPVRRGTHDPPKGSTSQQTGVRSVAAGAPSGADRGAGQSPGGGQAGETRGARDAREAREARKRRGQRKQARRLQQAGKKSAAGRRRKGKRR